MAVFRIERTRDYTVMSNHHLRNANLSLKAKGLLSMMLSLPEDWNYTTRGLAKICKEGVDAIGAALRELERAGYIVRHQRRDRSGRITDTEYVIYEQPHPDMASLHWSTTICTQAAGKGRLLSCKRRHDMNQMEIFKNPEFGSIRVIEENGKYLFCGTDVAAALGYSNPRDAIIRHCRCVVKRDAPHPQSPDRKISMTFIPEGDLYRLIVHSKLPSAERFERWVFDEVLPTIRKHGAYLTKEKLWEVATSPEALMKLCSDLLAEREANISLRKENAQLEGKAAFYDLFIDLKHSTNLRTTAKELDVPERRFVRFLIERRFVYRTASGNVLPYANVKNAGLFCVKDYCNHGHTGSYTLVTPQGKLYFAQLREMILLVS